MKEANNYVNLAKHLHDNYCHSNHIDGCSWYEEDISGPARVRWLQQAVEAVRAFEED